MNDSWGRFRSDLRSLKEAAGMSFKQIKAAAEAADAFLPTSTVSDLLGRAETKVGRECTGQLARLVEILIANTAPGEPAAAPWRDRASWQRRWWALDDKDRGAASPPPVTGTEGAFGWDGALEKLGLGAGTEIAWLKDRRPSRMAAVISELAALGMYCQAHDVACELLRCTEGTRGPRDPGVLAARHVAAYWTGEAGNPRTARDLTAALLADCREVLGEEHVLSRLAALRLAVWTTAAGDPAQGRRLFRELARGGSDDRITLLARLGGVRTALLAGEAEEAGDRLLRLLPALVAEYAEHHPVVIAARLYEAQALWAGTRRAHSGRLLDGLVGDATEHLGRAHPLTLYAQGLHARLVLADKDANRALELAEDAYAEAVRVLGADHPDSLSVGNILAIVRASSDGLAAEEMFGEVYRRAREALGPEHHLTLDISHNLAVVTTRWDLQAARALFEDVQEARIRVLGAEHPQTLLTRMAVAVAVLELDGKDAARPLLEEVHHARVRVLGSAHPDVEFTSKFLRIAAQRAPALPGGPSEH
ncbi:tetratricopeptide repeat protein [Streptomyces sp. NPDC002209]|uniref:tetratricopeptide repeat protein n=1 Tax=Streptomyces sp. NPDC002209 TaxID=3364638 RepID=UPI003688B301